ncbi:DUF2567 domain-containing protein [uncultured Jatrophihabitans sp.]|uniref:DUF2567 domain-containing protein n=1 Tax=uncultured Jatrophihabitans sp. TaxID=1610747 RepID=UPI0035C9AD5E
MTQPFGTQPVEIPPSDTRTDVIRAAVLALVLAVVGALAGLVWSAWSPKGPRALIVRPGIFEPDETESFVAGDGRFLVIAAVLGLVAALVVWFRRPLRGVAAAFGLAVGGFAGSLLMWLVGYLTGGGDSTGRAIPNSTQRYTAQLPLTVHADGVLLVQATVSMLVFGLLVAFAVRDDLGRPETGRPDPAPDLIAAGAHPQHGWGDGDAPGPLQQSDLSTQQPGHPDQPV